MLIPMHQPAYNQTCISYFVCCSARRPGPNWCLSAAVVHTGQSTRLLHRSQGIQIPFFSSLTPLIHKACPAEKGLGTKALRRPQAAPRAPSLRFPPRRRGWRPRPHGGGPGSWGPSPEPAGAPGPAAHPTAYFCPSRSHRPLPDERPECGANGLGGGRRRRWEERTAGRGVLPALPGVPATANRRQRRREAAHSAPGLAPRSRLRGRGCPGAGQPPRSALRCCGPGLASDPSPRAGGCEAAVLQPWEPGRRPEGCGGPSWAQGSPPKHGQLPGGRPQWVRGAGGRASQQGSPWASAALGTRTGGWSEGLLQKQTQDFSKRSSWLEEPACRRGAQERGCYSSIGKSTWIFFFFSSRLGLGWSDKGLSCNNMLILAVF